MSLSGLASSDDNTLPGSLGYAWTFTSRPAGSAATLAGADTATPSFFADEPGTYEVSLVVTDGIGQTSAPDTATIATTNQAPVASAGNAQAAVVGDLVTLDGSASIDPDGDGLAFAWSLAAPAGSEAVLAGGDGASPSFVPDLPGEYTATLVVADAWAASGPAAVVATVITAQEYVENQVMALQNTVGGLTPGVSVTTAGNQRAFQNFVTQALASLQLGDTALAIKKLEDARARTDGCALRGAPDGNGQAWTGSPTAPRSRRPSRRSRRRSSGSARRAEDPARER